MRGFKLDDKGDIVVESGKIAIVSGNELKAQTLRTTIGTNKGEWFLNENEGIDFRLMLSKSVTEDMQLEQIKDACRQVDDTLRVIEFYSEKDRARKAKINFTAVDSADNVISGEKTYE